jgi:hypothetical protein
LVLDSARRTKLARTDAPAAAVLGVRCATVYFVLSEGSVSPPVHDS